MIRSLKIPLVSFQVLSINSAYVMNLFELLIWQSSCLLKLKIYHEVIKNHCTIPINIYIYYVTVKTSYHKLLSPILV